LRGNVKARDTPGVLVLLCSPASGRYPQLARGRASAQPVKRGLMWPLMRATSPIGSRRMSSTVIGIPVLLVSRIREYWLKSGKTPADNDESVALGLARTGRVVTAAALVMSISFAALITAQVSFMRMFGVGLTLAVLADATLVRTLILPAFMHVLGRWNWWAPKPLARLHERIGVSESSTHEAHRPECLAR